MYASEETQKTSDNEDDDDDEEEFDIKEKKLSFAESHAMLDKINECSFLTRVILCCKIDNIKSIESYCT